ncbi:hypothetical protein AB0K92_15915 [Streptomyces sp. NPDC052687]|uniref:hypothetical protein n=1 Tax=Streptomyces sp. NPDC052687 TaxID=3154759 RepID=UPI00341F13F9
MLIIVTGPQRNDEEVGLIAEIAGLLDGVPAYSATIQWATATALYYLAGWEKCPTAVADMIIAETMDLVICPVSV